MHLPYIFISFHLLCQRKEEIYSRSHIATLQNSFEFHRTNKTPKLAINFKLFLSSCFAYIFDLRKQSQGNISFLFSFSFSARWKPHHGRNHFRYMSKVILLKARTETHDDFEEKKQYLTTSRYLFFGGFYRRAYSAKSSTRVTLFKFDSNSILLMYMWLIKKPVMIAVCSAVRSPPSCWGVYWSNSAPTCNAKMCF